MLTVGVAQKRVMNTVRKMPEARIASLAETAMRNSHSCYGPGRCSSHGMEHGENPEVATLARFLVQLRLEYVTHICQVRAVMSVYSILGLLCGATRIGKCQHPFSFEAWDSSRAQPRSPCW